GVVIKGILIQYHAWGGTCEKWENYSMTSTFTDEHGLILITACGSNFRWYYTSGWYAGVCCVDDHRIDDVEYTKTILERENKNNLPVYGYGYRAVAVNGVLALEPGLQGSFDTCDDIYNDANFGPKSPVPRVASLHCIDDETKFPRTNRDIRRWAGRLGCARKETTKTKLNEEMTLKEWKTDEFDPARWAVDFFLGLN
ncbi:hypothetical protein FOZ62_029792, partial [Perkinsus olseni]